MSVIFQEAWKTGLSFRHGRGTSENIHGRGSDKHPGKEYKSEFGVMEGTDAMNNVKILTGMQIDGALGVEFLAQYGITIDFKTYKLRCDDPK